jgi:hypothetical protein
MLKSLFMALLLLTRIAVADETPEAMRARGHHKKVVGAALIIVGGVFDAATTALTFTGLGRGGWSITPRSPTDTALLWTGVAGNFVLDSILAAGIIIYCDGGKLMQQAMQGK